MNESNFYFLTLIDRHCYCSLKACEGYRNSSNKDFRNNKRQSPVTGDTALRFSKYLGTPPKFWLGLHDDYDLEEEKFAKDQELKNVKHYSSDAA